MIEQGGLGSPPGNDFIIDGSPKYLLYKWVKVGEKPEHLPGYTFRSSNNYKEFHGKEYRQVTYRKYFQQADLIKQADIAHYANTERAPVVLPDYKWK